MFDTPFRSLLGFLSVLILGFALAFSFEANKQVAYEWRDLDDDQEEQLVLERLGRADKKSAYWRRDDPDPKAAPKEPAADPATIVIWLHVGGFRTDYMAKVNPVFLGMAESSGMFTKRFIPSYPTLTWPNLATQVTGLDLKGHGVSADSLRDPATGTIHEFPRDPKFLRGEPIWITAKRQGVWVLVHDWPFSQSQPSEHGADHFLTEFDPELRDEQRLDRIREGWLQDTGTPTKRLIMGCLFDLEKTARAKGTRDEDTLRAFQTMDDHLASFFDAVKEWQREPNHERDEIHVLISTAHGLADVKTKIDLPRLMGDFADGIDYALSDALAYIWFKDDVSNSDALAARIDSELGGRVFATLYKPEDYDENWGFDGDQRPDRIIALKPGYVFTSEPGSEPVYPAEETEGPFAASGYTLVETSRMRGELLYFQYPHYRKQGEFEETSPEQLHVSVCELLGIEPAVGSSRKSIFAQETVPAEQ